MADILTRLNYQNAENWDGITYGQKQLVHLARRTLLELRAVAAMRRERT